MKKLICALIGASALVASAATYIQTSSTGTAPWKPVKDSVSLAHLADSALHAPPSAYADSARASKISDSSKVLGNYARSSALHDTALTLRAYSAKTWADSASANSRHWIDSTGHVDSARIAWFAHAATYADSSRASGLADSAKRAGWAPLDSGRVRGIVSDTATALRTYIGSASTTGNAATATKLATARTITTSGDVTGTPTNFDGTANITIPMALPTLLTAGSAGSATAVPTLTWDAKGRLTAVGSAAISIPHTQISDWSTATSGFQPTLGFTPVQQGGGTSMGGNKVYIGWGTADNTLRLQVDAVNFGSTWPININGTASVAASVAWTSVTGRPTALSSFTNDAGYLTANQPISLTGAVTGSGTTPIATSFANTHLAGINQDLTTTSSPTFAAMYTNSTFGVCGIVTGNSDGAAYTAYNLKIKSWWGIGFESYDGVTRILMDTRTGGISTLGGINASGLITATGGISGNLTGTASNASALGGVAATDYGTLAQDTAIAKKVASDTATVLRAGIASAITTSEAYATARISDSLTANARAWTTLTAAKSSIHDSLTVERAFDSIVSRSVAHDTATTLRSNMAGYLPLIGGTLTGFLTGTSAELWTNINAHDYGPALTLHGSIYTSDANLLLRSSTGYGNFLGFSDQSKSAGLQRWNFGVENDTLQIQANSASDRIGGTLVFKLSRNGNLTIPGTLTASSLSGNSATATQLATPRTISTTGDGAWSTSFDGSANVTGKLTLATLLTAGSAGSATAVPTLTWDAKGRLTAVGSAAISIPHTQISDWSTATSGFQPTLGFTPVQQGGGTSMGGNKVYIGWGTADNTLRLQVDAVNFGSTWPININGTASVAASVAWTSVTGRPTALSSFTNDAGYLTANQSISLTGAVTGSGTTSIATSFANTHLAGIDQDLTTTSSPTFANLTLATGNSTPLSFAPYLAYPSGSSFIGNTNSTAVSTTNGIVFNTTNVSLVGSLSSDIWVAGVHALACTSTLNTMLVPLTVTGLISANGGISGNLTGHASLDIPLTGSSAITGALIPNGSTYTLGNSSNRWQVFGNIVSASAGFEGNLAGNVTGNVTGSASLNLLLAGGDLSGHLGLKYTQVTGSSSYAVSHSDCGTIIFQNNTYGVNITLGTNNNVGDWIISCSNGGINISGVSAKYKGVTYTNSASLASATANVGVLKCLWDGTYWWIG